MDQYKGQLVVLKNRWNIKSDRVGIVVEHDPQNNDVILVLWTDKDSNGIKLKYHLTDAVIPVNEITIGRIKERICDIK